jgi:hypothetical protein
MREAVGRKRYKKDEGKERGPPALSVRRALSAK